MWSGRWSCPRTAHPGSSSSPGCGTTPDFTACRRRAARRGSGGRPRSGARSWPRPARAAGGRGLGTRAKAFIYGRMRKVRWKEVVCLWRVLGHDVKAKAVVAEVEGYKKRFTIISSAVGLSGLELVELFAARFRQEDGFRDLKQRLGWEECRAWTRRPIERTSQGAVGDDEPAAAVAVPAGCRRSSGLVVCSAVEPEEGPAERAGRGAVAEASSAGNPAASVSMLHFART